MNPLQAALRNGRTPGDLSAALNLQVRQHPEFPGLHLFKYDQIASPMGDPICQVARGMILDADNDWEVVSWPFRKFWNYGEPLAAPIDWESAVVQEKLDGSLMSLYHYQGEWHVASSGTPDGGGDVNGMNITFADLFWKVFAAQGMSVTDLDIVDVDERTGSSRDWSRFTFMFELMTPYNQIVVRHKGSGLKLIGCRDRIRGTEVSIYGLPFWSKVKAFPLGSMDAIQEVLKDIDPFQQEGFVVVDKHWNRIKVKSEDYVRLHHLRGNGTPTPKRVLQTILLGETEEILGYWPDWRPLFDSVDQRLTEMKERLESWYENAHERPHILELFAGRSLAPAEAQKEFAAVACKSPCPSILFLLRAGKIKSIQEGLRELSVDKLADLLQLQVMEPAIFIREEINGG